MFGHEPQIFIQYIYKCALLICIRVVSYQSLSFGKRCPQLWVEVYPDSVGKDGVLMTQLGKRRSKLPCLQGGEEISTQT